MAGILAPLKLIGKLMLTSTGPEFQPLSLFQASLFSMPNYYPSAQDSRLIGKSTTEDRNESEDSETSTADLQKVRTEGPYFKNSS